MSRDKAYLYDILDSARAAIEYMGDLPKDTFFGLREKQDSVVRRLEVIGEAARRLSADTRAAFPDIPWQRMIGMRNIVIHRYDNVDLSIVYDTVAEDLPKLIRRIEQYFAQEEGQ